MKCRISTPPTGPRRRPAPREMSMENAEGPGSAGDGLRYAYPLTTGTHEARPVAPHPHPLTPDLARVIPHGPRDRRRPTPPDGLPARRPEGTALGGTRPDHLLRPEDSRYVFGPAGHELNIFRADV